MENDKWGKSSMTYTALHNPLWEDGQSFTISSVHSVRYRASILRSQSHLLWKGRAVRNAQNIHSNSICTGLLYTTD